MGSGWIVEHRCTQCGAPITLEETDRLFTCPFCRVRICLTAKDCFRYYLPPPDNTAEEMFYIPYWRIRGMIFSCDEELEVKSAIVDATHCGTGAGIYPESLGLRPQTLKLRFATPESGKSFPEPSFTFQEAFDKIEAGLPLYQQGNTPAQLFHRTFIGEKVSIVYAPFFIKNRAFHDGLLGRPFKPLKDGTSEYAPPGGIGHPLLVFPALCPECGWDLEGGRDSVVFFCKNCNKAWYLTAHGLEQKAFFVLDWGDEQTAYLPFWRIKADISGLDLRSFGDLARLANLPIVVREEMESTNLFFWVPGFRVHAPLFLRLARLLTLQQPQQMIESEKPLVNPWPASLPMGDAPDSLKIIIASLIATKRQLWPSLEAVSARAMNIELVYVPFLEQKDELFNPRLKLTVNKNSLKYGQNI